MMMLPDKKQLSTVILSKMKGGEAQDTVAAPEADMRGEGPLDMIAQDLLHAFETKSIMGIKDALRAFIDYKDSDIEESEE